MLSVVSVGMLYGVGSIVDSLSLSIDSLLLLLSVSIGVLLVGNFCALVAPLRCLLRCRF